MTTWPDLPPEILNKIAGKFQFYEDLINFLFVCSSWRSSATTTNKTSIHHLPSKFPMLMLSDSNTEEQDHNRIFLLSNGTIRKLQLPEAHRQRCISSHGWLLTTGESEFYANLLHPLSRTQIDLPKLYMFEEFHFDQDEWIYYGQSMRKAVFTSSNPLSNPSFRVIIIWGKTLGFCRPGFDVSWTRITGWKGDIFDITYHNMRKRLYVVATMGSIYECDVFSESGSLTLNRVSTFPLKEFDFSSFQWAYILEWDHDSLLMVTRERRYYKRRDYEYGCYGPYSTRKFECFVLGLEDGKWSKVVSLGDKSVFLGFNSSFVVNAGGGVKCDCIYFTDDLYEPYRDLPVGGGRDVGVYRMCDGGIESILESREGLDFRGSPPLWLQTSVKET